MMVSFVQELVDRSYLLLFNATELQLLHSISTVACAGVVDFSSTVNQGFCSEPPAAPRVERLGCGTGVPGRSETFDRCVGISSSGPLPPPPHLASLSPLVFLLLPAPLTLPVSGSTSSSSDRTRIFWPFSGSGWPSSLRLRNYPLRLLLFFFLPKKSSFLSLIPGTVGCV